MYLMARDKYSNERQLVRQFKFCVSFISDKEQLNFWLISANRSDCGRFKTINWSQRSAGSHLWSISELAYFSAALLIL